MKDGGEAKQGSAGESLHALERDPRRQRRSWIDLADENISFGSLAEGADPDAFTRKLQGKSSLRSYFDGLTSNWTMLHHTMDRLVAEGDQVVAIGSCAWKYNKTGKIVETPIVNVWRFKNGKAVSYYEFYDTAKMFAATAP